MKTKKVIILTESELLLNSDYEELAVIFAGSSEELEKILLKEETFIPDLFERDPDYIRIPELTKRIPFVEYELNFKGEVTHFGIVPDYVDGYATDEITKADGIKIKDYLKLFLDNDFELWFKSEKNTWEHFDTTNNGIAFRGGDGYNYTIWDYK